MSCLIQFYAIHISGSSYGSNSNNLIVYFIVVCFWLLCSPLPTNFQYAWTQLIIENMMRVVNLRFMQIVEEIYNQGTKQIKSIFTMPLSPAQTKSGTEKTPEMKQNVHFSQDLM